MVRKIEERMYGEIQGWGIGDEFFCWGVGGGGAW